MSTLFAELLVNGPRMHDSREGVRPLRGNGGLTERDLAAIAEAAQRFARHHAELPAAVSPSLDGLREIAAELDSSLTARGICQWLEAPNRYLHDERPLVLLLRGEPQQVHAAAAAFGEGVCV